MKKRFKLTDALITLTVLLLGFGLSLLLQQFFDAKTLIPMVFVLGVFLISLKTNGYFWGVAASLLSVFAVNYAFTFPYYGIDLITPVNLVSAVVMLVVAIMTCTLTTQVKLHEKMKAESEKERLRANLLRAISHDLRTPLTTIYGSSSAVIENYDTLTKDQKLKLLCDVREDSEWLTRMVENLLSVTRVDGDNVQIAMSPTVLEELIDTVLIKLRKRCPDTEVSVDIPDDFISIPMDALLIEQVLINILENAVIHAKGMTALSLKVTLSDTQAQFSVTDNGCGIPEEMLPFIFTGYLDRDLSAADSHRSRTGIGLSACSAIIKAHGGSIQAKNNSGGGATFTFTLKTENSNER